MEQQMMSDRITDTALATLELITTVAVESGCHDVSCDAKALAGMLGELREHRGREIWIPCSERMPEVLHDDENDGCSEWVNVYAPARGVDMAFWDGGRWYWSSVGYAITSEVTLWRPCPPPPETP